MKKILIFLLVFVCIVSAVLYFLYRPTKENTGVLHINAVSDFNVFFDEEFKGTTTREEGLNLSNLPVGKHKVRVEKKDLEPQYYEVTIEPNKKAEITLTVFISKRKSEEISIENIENILLYSPVPDKIIISHDKKIKSKNIINTIDMKMVRIIPGSFFMEEKSEKSNDIIKREVTISKPFMIGKYEVTQKQYQDVMSHNPSHFKGKSLPVEQVRWGEAVEFCKRLTERERALGKISTSFEYSLPTEAQWEYVACCGENNDIKYSGSSDLNTIGWYKNNSSNTSHPIGQKLPNEWNVYDVSGNVWEWCLDWHEAYTEEEVKDPNGPISGVNRVVRGGSWYNSSWFCTTSYRFWYKPSFKHFTLGFRVCLNICE